MLRTALEKTGHENGGLETTMFTSLSRKSGHFVSLMYDLYSETFIIKASVDHNVSFQEVTTIRDQITTDLSTLSGRLVGEWLIVNCADPKLNNQRVHVYLVERNSVEFLDCKGHPIVLTVAWAFPINNQAFLDAGMEPFCADLKWDFFYRNLHAFWFNALTDFSYATRSVIIR